MQDGQIEDDDPEDGPSHSTGPRRPYLLKILGPGLITGAADDDPSGIATYSQAGAQFGYVGWTMLFTYPLMVAIQEISARIGRTTGRGIAGNLRRHYPRWLLRPWSSLLLRRQHRQSGRRSRRDGRGAAAADRRPRAALCRAASRVICVLLRSLS